MTDSDLNAAVSKKLGRGRELASCEHRDCEGNYPDYSTDIKAAWEIVEHLRKTHQMMIDIAFDKFQVTICNEPPNEINFTFEADAAAKAICLAFLKLDAQCFS